MAKRKWAIHIRRRDEEILEIYCDHRAGQASRIEVIEGVITVMPWRMGFKIWVDLRYDVDEVTLEIAEALAALIEEAKEIGNELGSRTAA